MTKVLSSNYEIEAVKPIQTNIIRVQRCSDSCSDTRRTDKARRVKDCSTHTISTTRIMMSESLIPSPKNAGPALPVPKARILKLQVNHTQNSWYMRLSVRFDGGTGEILHIKHHLNIASSTEI